MDNIKQLSSINIIRDQDKSIDYIPTENSKRIANFILNEFHKGVHCFNLIGSYGTGKSSFLWAFNRNISNSNTDNYFDLKSNLKRKCEFINIVGEYNSLISFFKTYFSIENKLKGNQEILDSIFQKYDKVNKQNGLLVICIDEFGKFLEYASKHNPEKEMYFIQQLAEFVNDSNRNIILLTSVHQAIDSYSSDLTESQKNEWKKVKGRLCEITFNEPIEQLLFLASQYFSSKYESSKKYISYNENLNKLNESNNCFLISKEYVTNIGNNLFPLDVFSAIILTYSLQRYGQNERSLFTFLNTSDHLGLDSLKGEELFDIPKLYDYLLVNLYSILVSKHNPDYSQWALVKSSIERAEANVEENQNIALDLLKIIGLFNLFSSKGASINDKLLLDYLSYKYNSNDIEKSLKSLDKFKIIRFNNFNNSYKLFGGTDLDIEGAILKASESLDESLDIVYRLNEAFDFPVLTAKETLYITGTPRLFKFNISENLSFETPVDEIDGFINLIFNEKLSDKDIIEQTSGKDMPILYGLYKNSTTIKKTLLDIVKTEKVLSEVDVDDTFAKTELKNIINSQKSLLNHYVLDSLYSRNIEWFFNGQRREINSKQSLNKILSEICRSIYPYTPIINMELVNKHKVSGAISSARKSYFDRLVNNWSEEDFGYPEDKFPPDKTIYWSLIRNTGIHRDGEGSYILTSPNSRDKNFIRVWQECELFLKEAKKEQKQITDLIATLKQKPYKLKQGVIDFLVPTFLFVRRGDFALYNVDGGYMPYINETVLYLLTRNPDEYSVKSFELDNLRLDLFNKYRVYLNLDKKNSMTNESFIESVRPFLILYRGLPEYSTKTQRLSQEALKLRSAISHAEDPEKVFFEQFPGALGYNVKELVENEQLFDEYIIKFQKTIIEVKDSYQELLNRFENFLTVEILGLRSNFPKYKTQLQKRFSSLKEHQILPSQKTFMLRVNSELDDRDSWLNSICFSLLSKPLDRISDKDEDTLKEKLRFIVKELDNICDIKNVNFDESEEEIYKIDFTSQNQGLKNHLVRISKQQKEEVEKSMAEIQSNLGDDKQLRIAILTELLKKELNE
ncbi:hypothetical protein [Confluentibacter sediminis]|uniref:hypothetical protein n=1 Tax=Confluentibacter sediminis TaxID=2219045 RepID=UPI000DAD2D04|nr:hypothetical protein [Confluentibacter sediminis]